MTKADLSMHVLRLLFNANHEMRPKEIEQSLWESWDTDQHSTFSKNREAFHVRIHRVLHSLEKYDLIVRREVSYKDKRYSIKDREYVQLILAADAIGLDLLKKPVSIKLSAVLRGKTYGTVVQKISELLLRVVLQRRSFARHTHAKFPVPMIFGFPIPISEEKGNIVRDKVLIIAPDETSASKIRLFDKEQYEDFLGYLTSAWRSYFEEFRITHGNIVIIHFTDQQAERLRRISKLGKLKSLDYVVHLATSMYGDRLEKGEKHFVETGPTTKMAIDKGIYKDKREAIEDSIKRNESRLAEILLEIIE